MTNTKIIKINPTQAIKFMRKAKTTKPKSLGKAEIHALLSVALQSAHGLNNRNYAAIHLILQTGLRIGEVINLQWRDLTSHDRSGFVRVISKGLKERAIPLNGTIRRAIANYVEGRNLIAETPLFLSKRGEIPTPRALQKIISNLAKRANITRIQLTPNVLRHTFATNYLRTKPSCLIELATLLGYDSLNTTAIYTKASSEHLKKYVRKITIS